MRQEELAEIKSSTLLDGLNSKQQERVLSYYRDLSTGSEIELLFLAKQNNLFKQLEGEKLAETLIFLGCSVHDNNLAAIIDAHKNNAFDGLDADQFFHVVHYFGQQKRIASDKIYEISKMASEGLLNPLKGQLRLIMLESLLSDTSTPRDDLIQLTNIMTNNLIRMEDQEMIDFAKAYFSNDVRKVIKAINSGLPKTQIEVEDLSKTKATQNQIT